MRKTQCTPTKSDPTMLITCSYCGNVQAVAPQAVAVRCFKCRSMIGIPSTDLRPTPVPQHTPAPPNAHGSKKALICGISHSNTRQELKGSLNDARCMKYMLMTKFKFPGSSILLLTEDQKDRLKLPTKANMKMAMFWLVQGCRAGDSLVFHYSGHGSQQRDMDGDERDRCELTLLPMDYKKNGVIVDDEMNLALVRPLTSGVRLHAIVDACHSGTVLDLPYLCRMSSQGSFVWENHSPPSGAWKGTSGGEAYCFSGCADDQTSADTTALSQHSYTGAMTFCFMRAIEKGHMIRAVEKGRMLTYGDILNAMREGVQGVETRGSSGAVTSLIQMLLAGGSFSSKQKQEPQLTASHTFHIDSPFYL